MSRREEARKLNSELSAGGKRAWPLPQPFTYQFAMLRLALAVAPSTAVLTGNLANAVLSLRDLFAKSSVDGRGCDSGFVGDSEVRQNRTSGYVFETDSGRPLSPRNILRESLHKILVNIGSKQDGLAFHSFRRFPRYTPARSISAGRYSAFLDWSCGQICDRSLLENEAADR